MNDDPTLVYWMLFFVICIILTLSTGCANIPPTPFDHQPFIYIE